MTLAEQHSIIAMVDGSQTQIAASHATAKNLHEALVAEPTTA